MSIRALLALLLPSAYWAMVLANIEFVRRRTGTAPALSPSLKEERILRLGWHLVIAAWFLQPALLLAWDGTLWWPFRPLRFAGAPAAAAGLALAIAGLALTKWCHLAMGEQWRMWVDPGRPSLLVAGGPFRWVRHPIYASQALVLWGTWLLAPTPFLGLAAALHLACMGKKSSLEERHLLGLHGAGYESYRKRTGRFVPRIPSRRRAL